MLLYVRSLALQEGDRRVQEYTASHFEPDEEFVVDAIVAERKRSGWEYLVKWRVGLVQLQINLMLCVIF